MSQNKNWPSMAGLLTIQSRMLAADGLVLVVEGPQILGTAIANERALENFTRAQELRAAARLYLH